MNRESLDAAIKAFTAAPHREAQAARAIWKKGCLLKAVKDGPESEKLFSEAMRIRHKILPKDTRQLEELRDKDWADPIFYWSR